MSHPNTARKTNWRWVICAMLFLATTVNYMDRQVLSLTWKDFIALDFHWDDDDYGTITAIFSLFYAIVSLFSGKFIDWMGTKKGYIWAIIIWSVGACLHAGCGWVAMTAEGASSIAELRLIDKASQITLIGLTLSVWLFLACRIVLALGESGNFPAAIKVTAEYFPKKDRAFATSIFNAGASVGALVAPLSIPVLAQWWGWEMAFIIIGSVGFLWAGAWAFIYTTPEKSRFVNEAELFYIQIDKENVVDTPHNVAHKRTEDVNAETHLRPYRQAEAAEEEKGLSLWQCFKYRQTWAVIVGKLMTDGVWWFLLFWAPAYFSELGYPTTTFTGQMLVFTLYLIVTLVSIMGGYLPKYFVEKRGMRPYKGRMRAMLIFAFLPVLSIFAQPLSGISPWIPAVIIGLAGAGHQAWSANLYSTIGDMFPKSAIATITGIGTMFGGLCSFAINYYAGKLFKYADAQGAAFQFFGVEGKPAGYMIVFCYCAVAYVLCWCIMHILVPKYKPIVLD